MWAGGLPGTLFSPLFNLPLIICHKFDELHPRDSRQTSRARLEKTSKQANGIRSTHFQVSSVAPSAHCAYFTFLHSLYLQLSLALWWLPNDCLECWEAAQSCCAFRLLLPLHRLNSPPLMSSPLCSSLLPCLISPSMLPAAAHLQTILEEDLEDPVYQVTFWPITSLLSTCCILVQSACSSLCALWGDSSCFGHNPYSLEGFRRPQMFVWSQE